MGETPLVSVVIPAFNASDHLEATVQSVLIQDIPSSEIIVVDDGSTDSTAEIIRSFGDRVKCLSGPNRGASAARNRGTSLARGKFIQYLDSDDLLTEDSLRLRLEALGRTGADVAYSDWQILEEKSPGIFKPGQLFSRPMESIDSNPEISIFMGFWAPPAALLYRHTIVERIGPWNESLPIIQDARFLLDAALRGASFQHVSVVGALYRIANSPSSLSRSDPLAFTHDLLRNASEVESWWRENGGLSVGRKTALAAVYDQCARRLFELDPDSFEECLDRLYRVRPGLEPTFPKVAKLVTGWIGHRRAQGVLNRLSWIKSAARRFQPASTASDRLCSPEPSKRAEKQGKTHSGDPPKLIEYC